MRLTIKKTNGAVVNRAQVDNLLRRIPDGQFVLTVKKWQPPITKEQRGFWHGVLVKCLMEDQGYTTAEEAHDALVRSLLSLPWEKIRPSTSDAEMGRDDKSDLIERACAYLVADLGCTVQGPEEFSDAR